MNGFNQDNYSNLLNALSLYISLLNLRENEIQSAHNDVQAANDKQAEYLLNEINDRFAEQNEVLDSHTKMLKKILDKLGG